MKFLGRVKELAVLEDGYARSGSFAIVYGRRRVGKTRLIKQFIQGKPALYFLASKENDALNRQRFAQAVARFIGVPELGEGSFSDWRPLFQMLASFKGSDRGILVIDEFPYLMEGNSAFPSILQYAWDEVLKDSGMMLILCGSSVHMMEEGVLSATSPLYGRSTTQIRLKALSFDEAKKGFPGLCFDDQARMYAVTGGVPKYMEFFEGESVESAIRKNILSTSGFLYNEPRFLLAQDTRTPITYYSVLRAVAYGKHKLSEIAAMLEKSQTEISPYVKLLERLGYVARRTPATDLTPEKSKNGLYYICDGLLDFWFTYVLPYEGELEMGNMEPSLRAMESTFDKRFVAFAFEEISRQATVDLCLAGDIPFEPRRVGSFWNKKNTVEIDVCATSRNGNSLLLGECKYHKEKPFSMREYRALLEKVEKSGIAEGKELLLCLFSKTGFEQGVLDLFERGKTLFLINQNRLV